LLVVLNRVPRRCGLTDTIAAKLADSGAALATTRIGDRVARARAMTTGPGVVEIDTQGPAAAEINVLAREVHPV
jgi:cellulose biosynthesis protein BcsQ